MLTIGQLIGVMRETARKLREPADKLIPLIREPKYKLAKRMINEYAVEQATQHIGNSNIVFQGMTSLPENPKPPSEYAPNNLIKKLSREICFSNTETENKIKTEQNHFKAVQIPLTNHLAYITEAITSLPKLLNKPILHKVLHKEEAETLADIFEILADQYLHDVNFVVKNLPNGIFTIYEESISNQYTYISREFKKLSRICPELKKEAKAS